MTAAETPRTSGVSPGGEQARGPRPASDARHRAAAPRLPARSIALEESAAEQEDRLLAIRAGEGDDDAFATLVERHVDGLLALAGHLMGNRHDAEDSVQEAFLSAWRRLPQFRGDAAFRTWMYRIVTNRCFSVLRSRPPPAAPLDAGPEPAQTAGSAQPERAAEAHAATDALARALARLDEGQRACWVLRELHGLHYDEIAQITGISEPSVRGRLYRARRTLAQEMFPWR
ncbi:RNA polymerase sigma factor [Kitasatospora herbaricolor]|uniref:RNA polymerase sigma factor n=1 Tax=Kitasatospora herbaricolor TaxID=68217 RepID=UPI002E2FAB81|nr:sigma-70 family RNA polymerase sigma factor [Kitasatospora herbaricolor]